MPLSLRIRGPSGAVKSVELLTASATVKELRSLICAAFDAPSAASVQLRAGFPPQLILDATDDGSDNTITLAGLTAASMLMFTLDAPPAAPAAPAAPQPQSSTSRPVRAAATRARAVIADEFAAEEAAAASLSRPRTSSGRAAPTPARVHTLGSSSSSSSRKRPRAFTGTARTLDGRSVTVQPRKRARRVQLAGDRSSLEAQIVSAFDGGRGKGDATVDYLRSAAQLALTKQYDLALATARVAAARSGRYEITPALAASASAPAQLRVRFATGERTRVLHEEVVDNVPLVGVAGMLKQLASGGNDSERELLKPHLTAQVSPRIFWAIVRYAPPGVDASSAVIVPMDSKCVDLEAAYPVLVPSVDWSFLQERARRMSEKALAAAASASLETSLREARRKKRLGIADEPAPLQPASDAHAAPAPKAASTGPSVVCVDSLSVAGALMAAGRVTAPATRIDSIDTCNATLHGNAAFTAVVKAIMMRGGAGLPTDMASYMTMDSATQVDALVQACEGLTGTNTLPAVAALIQRYACHADEEMEERTFVCSACDRARVVSSRDADLDAVQACDDWACASSNIPSLLTRGACSAPDDELSACLESTLPAALVTQLGIPSIAHVAQCVLPDDDAVLYAGEEDFPPPLAFAASLRLPLDAIAAITTPTLSSRIAARIPSVAALTTRTLTHAEGDAFAIMRAPLPAEHATWHVPREIHRSHAGMQLVFAAAVMVVAAHEATGAPSQPHTAAADLLLRHARTAVALMRTPVGWCVASSIARGWHSAAMAAFMDERMREVLQTALEASGVDEDSLQDAMDAACDALEALELRTPADVQRMAPALLATALAGREQWPAIVGALHGEDSSGHAVKLAERIAAAARQTIDATPWLADVFS